MAMTRRAVLSAAAMARLAVPARAQTSRGALVMQASPFIRAIHEQVAAAFEQSSGTAVHVRLGPRNDGEAVQQILRYALVGEPLPDLVFLDGNLVRILAERGLAADLGPFIQGDSGWSGAGFTQAVASSGQVGGHTHGLAFGLSLPCVLFNAALVRRAGGDIENLPTDWPGILALAERIDRLGSGVVGGYIEYNNTGALSFLALLESHGGRAMSDDERSVAFESAEGLSALAVLRGFAQRGGQARAAMTRDQSRAAFGAGTIGVNVTMSSTIQFQEQAAQGRFEVVAMPYPIAARTGRLPAAGPIAVMLARDPAKQRATFELMKFASGPRGQTILAAGSGYAPVNEIAIRDSEMLGRVLAARRNARAYLERLDVATRWYAFPGANAVRITDVIRDHLERVVTLAATPEQALAAMARDVRALLAG